MKDPVHDTLATLGNSNIIGGYLKHYEDEITRRHETTQPLACAPNYYAWLCVASEYVLYSVRQIIFLKSKADESEVFDMAYARLLDRLKEVAEVPSETQADILLFLKIRHIVVHKGFPNLHDVPSNSTRALAKGVAFTYEDVREIRSRVMRPDEFPSLREQFKRVGGSLWKLQGPFKLEF